MEKKTLILIADQKEGVDLDKKKYSLGLEDFAHIFVLLTNPYVMFLIAHQKEGVDLDKKSTAKDLGYFAHMLLTTPYVMFEYVHKFLSWQKFINPLGPNCGWF